MNVTEEIEKKFDIKVETFNDLEKETYYNMLEQVQKAQMSPEKLKAYISSMKAAVETELTKIDLTSQQDIFLKARLKNYLLLESFLISPEKAKQVLEDMISSMTIKKGV